MQIKEMYEITEHTRRAARRLGVEVRPSKVKGKKIDVFRSGQKVASVGALGFGDFPTFIKRKGREFAEARRAAYKKRHAKDRAVPGTPGFYADQLLW